MNIQFGTGVLFGTPVSGNTPANPTPYKFGILQEVTVDFKGDLKKLYGQSQLPVATARGKIEVSVKGKLALFDLAMINQLYWAQTQSQGYNLIVDGEQKTVTANIVTAANVPIVDDLGVQYANGQQLTKIPSGTPALGQYKINLTSGVYTFASTDNTNVVALSYTYAVNTAATASVVLSNQLMGYAPELSMFLYNKFRNKYLACQLNAVTLGQLSVPTKLEDFWIADFDGNANVDANGILGKLMMDLV